jgi:hypothetical protein
VWASLSKYVSILVLMESAQEALVSPHLLRIGEGVSILVLMESAQEDEQGDKNE